MEGSQAFKAGCSLIFTRWRDNISRRATLLLHFYQVLLLASPSTLYLGTHTTSQMVMQHGLDMDNAIFGDAFTPVSILRSSGPSLRRTENPRTQ